MENQVHHKSLAYRPDVDGLRALAILLVVGYHAFPGRIKFGFIGVDIFFVISGYLIGGILLLNLKTDSFSLKNFYYRRILRIFPALIMTLLCCFAAGYLFLFPDELKSLGKHIIAGSLFSENLLLWSEVGYFDTAAHTKPLLNLWSLGIEEQFYFIFPLFLYFIWKSKISFAKALAICVALFFCFNMVLYELDKTADFYSPFSRFWELLAGALLKALEAGNGKGFGPEGIPRKYLNLGLAVLGCIFLVIAFFVISDKKYPGFASVLPVVIAVLFIAAGPHNILSKIFLCNKISIFIGKISYPLYLCHWPLLSFAYIISGKLGSSRSLRLTLVAIAFIAASSIYFMIERPVRFKHVLGKYTVPTLIFGLLACVTLGLVITYVNDLPFRSRIESITKITKQFVRSPYSNDICWKYTKLNKKDTSYCLYKDMGAEETIAIFGDSHAHAAFAGLADLSEKMEQEGKAFNVLCIGRSADKLVNGTGENIFLNNVKPLLDFLEQKPEIKKVFLITRGMPWLSSFSTDGKVRYKSGKITETGERRFTDEISSVIGRLQAMGKEVAVQQDVPALPVSIRDAFKRTYRWDGLDYSWNREKLSMKKSDLLESEKPYARALNAISSRTGAEILYSNDVFCPDEMCLFLTKDGLPLYADRDHVSLEGSKIQAEKIFLPWILKH